MCYSLLGLCGLLTLLAGGCVLEAMTDDFQSSFFNEPKDPCLMFKKRSVVTIS